MAKKIIQKTKNPMPCRTRTSGPTTSTKWRSATRSRWPSLEAQRCIQCKNEPCVAGCPVEIDIPKFIQQVAEGDFDGAFHTLLERNVLPAICGRVCPQEEQCEGSARSA